MKDIEVYIFSLLLSLLIISLLGAGVLEFENTLSAFRKAIDLKLDSCELDVKNKKQKNN